MGSLQIRVLRKGRREGRLAWLVETGPESLAMRRWLALFLLVLLPLQFSWAAVAPYCLHDACATTRHFGHHEHEHHQLAGSAGVSVADAADSASFAIDADCAVCHAGGAAALVAFPVFALDSAPALPESRYPLVPAAPPGEQRDRPNWPVSV